jgi:Bacterial Ig domain
MVRVRPASILSLLLPLILFGFQDASAPAVAGWKLVATNDLGMHCMDSDFSVFSILPPFNNVYAQLIDPNGNLVTSPSGFTLSYEGVADPTGSINTTSAGKTNYWTWTPALFGAPGVVNTGLTGNNMPGTGNPPQPMSFDATQKAWVATGVPITPTDDAGHRRPYPLMKIVARDLSGTVLATTTPVLPVSTEMDCRACHASGSGPDAQPAGGWVWEKKSERDYRFNILRLHDQHQAGFSTYTQALANFGYNPAGLEATVRQDGKPILCATCHASNALGTGGFPGVGAFTSSMHANHALVIDPTTGLTLDDSDNRSACYRCHPGSSTRCLRGAMGAAVAPDAQLEMQCQSCHGNMSKVGSTARQGWLDEPNCQACHTGTAVQNNGKIRYTDVFEPNGQMRVAVNQTFATNPNTPMAPYSLFKLSDGHGGLRCENCHGSTHAEYPSIHDNDNLGVLGLQGHVGMAVECTSCHASSPVTVKGGPHGMHPVGSPWVAAHGNAVESGGSAQCRDCHGLDFKGTVLSAAQANRSFATGFGTKTFFDGAVVSCYACHNGPGSESPTTDHKPAASNKLLTVGDVAATITLTATDADLDPLTYRVVKQPVGGRVGVLGAVATYDPDPGFAGVDTFTYAAWDGKLDSNLATVTVTRLGNSSSFGLGYGGTGGVVPEFTATGAPTVGGSFTINVGNSSGLPTSATVFVSLELAQFDTKAGGALVVEPTLIAGFPLPPGGLAAPTTLPNDPTLVGVVVLAQSLQPDPGAQYGWAFSQGLRLALGP